MHKKIFALLLPIASFIFHQGCVSKVSKTEKQVVIETINSNWLYWRGADGTGVSDQTGLPTDLNKSLIWTHDIQGGRGTSNCWGQSLSIWLLRYNG
jgi:hypothetical protein